MSIRVRAILSLKNDIAVAAREALGWTQKCLAIAAETTQQRISQIETFKLHEVPIDVAIRVATVLDLTIEDLIPPELEDQHIRSTFMTVRRMNPNKLIEMVGRQNRLLIESPEEKLLNREKAERLWDRIGTCLNVREQYVIIHRFGLMGESQKTLESLGKDLNLSRMRVRQIEARAVRKLKEFYERTDRFSMEND